MTQRVLHGLLTAILLFAALTFVSGETTESRPDSASPELNDKFVDPELDVESWVQRFEVESREVYSARMDVLRATGVKAGLRVADIGAGTGLYTRLFSGAVGADGWVYAVEISPRFLEHINEWVETEAKADSVLADY